MSDPIFHCNKTAELALCKDAWFWNETYDCWCLEDVLYTQVPHLWLVNPRCKAPEFLAQGYVYVTCGNRGLDSKDPNGVPCSKSPMNLVDLKMAVRFLRHNRACLPGNLRPGQILPDPGGGQRCGHLLSGECHSGPLPPKGREAGQLRAGVGADPRGCGLPRRSCSLDRENLPQR